MVRKEILYTGVFFVVLFLTGCIDLAVNDGKNKRVDLKKISHLKGEVYTMRGGLGGIFSKGMNRLEDTLENNYQINASSTVWYKEKALSRSIIQKYKTQRTHAPIILIGHSLGANAQIQVAKELNNAHIPVALLMTVDAVLPDAIPPNVVHMVNIYKPSFVPMFSGLVLHATDPKHTQVNTINIATMKGADVNHFTIDGNEVVQNIMLREVLSTLHLSKAHETA